MKSLSLYIHIPFCESKCYYCDFLSFKKDDLDIKEYVDNVILELALYRDKLKDYKIDTIFIGGGTPSSIAAEYIQRILGYIHENFNVDSLRETTIEVNPGSLTRDKVAIYKESKINRVSMGMQSFNEGILKSIGRIHGVDDFYTSYELLIEAEIYNINIDLILGLPDQEEEDIIKDLKILTDLNIPHISYYGLIIEDGTAMKDMYIKKEITIPEEDIERRMYHSAVKFLKKKGYIHYEISNFALPNFQCNHNMTYWKIRPYVGVGLGSHSNIDNRRYWNEKSFLKYKDKLKKALLPVEEGEDIDLNTEISEYSIMGLRLIEGINKEKFKKRFNLNFRDIYGEVLDKHIKNGLLIEECKYIYLTSKGLDLANRVEVDFLL